MLKQCDDTYLSRGFNAFDKAQHHDHPREEQAKSEVPLDGANVLDTAGEMQDMPPAMWRHTPLSTLQLKAREKTQAKDESKKRVRKVEMKKGKKDGKAGVKQTVGVKLAERESQSFQAEWAW